MKRSILTALSIVLAIPSLSYAVRVKDCPENINLSLSKLTVISAETLKKELSVAEIESGEHEALRQALEANDSIQVAAKLTKPGKARCEYSVTESSISFGEKGDEFVLASSKGKDWIRLRLNSKKGIIGVFVKVASYSKDGIEAAGSASMGLDDSNHPGNVNPVLAWARSVVTK